MPVPDGEALALVELGLGVAKVSELGLADVAAVLELAPVPPVVQRLVVHAIVADVELRAASGPVVAAAMEAPKS